MLNWELKEDIWYGTDSLNPKWLFRIMNVSKQGFEPYQLFCNEMGKIKEDYFPYDSEDMEKFFLTKLVLELFNNGWFEIESSREILIRDIQSHYLMPCAKKQICEFDKKTSSVLYIDNLDSVLEINKLKLQDHAEFLINSGWNPFM